MTVRTVTAVAVECDQREDSGERCTSVLRLPTDAAAALDEPRVLARVAATARGWSVDEDSELCPKHRTNGATITDLTDVPPNAGSSS